MSPCLAGIIATGTHDPSNTPDILPAFSIFERTPIGKRCERKAWYKHLYVTEDFAKAIDAQDPNRHLGTTCLRDVNWILNLEFSDNLLIVSQYEANAMMPAILQSHKVVLKLYFPRIARSMGSYDDLEYYSIARDEGDRYPTQNAMMMLNAFTASLFFKDKFQYNEFCSFLGVLHKGRMMTNKRDKEQHVSSDGFVFYEYRRRRKNVWSSE